MKVLVYADGVYHTIQEGRGADTWRRDGKQSQINGEFPFRRAAQGRGDAVVVD